MKKVDIDRLTPPTFFREISCRYNHRTKGGVAPVKHHPLHRPVLIQFAVLEKKS